MRNGTWQTGQAARPFPRARPGAPHAGQTISITFCSDALMRAIPLLAGPGKRKACRRDPERARAQETWGYGRSR